MTHPVASLELIDSLTPWGSNPRHNEKAIDLVAASIERFGFASPIIARRSDRVVIAGHTRLAAAKKLGLQSVPVRFMDLDPSESAALALADNKLGELAKWDEKMLADVLDELSDQGTDLDGLGWSNEELDELLNNEALPSASSEPAPILQAETFSVAGEVYELGPHLLVCGDCTADETWRLLQLNPADAAVFTSPPYAAGKSLRGAFTGSKGDHHNNKAKARGGLYLEQESPWIPMMMAWTELALTYCKQVVVNLQLLAGCRTDLPKWIGAFAQDTVDMAMWDKGHGPPQAARNVLTNAYEFVFILSKGAGSRAVPFGDFQGNQPNIHRGDIQRNNDYADIHSATFPAHFAEWGVSVLCATAPIIVDPFAGTGTTLMAAIDQGKSARLIEREPQYCDVIRRRWTAHAKSTGIDPGAGMLEEVSK